jgi:hypothetical protein
MRTLEEVEIQEVSGGISDEACVALYAAGGALALGYLGARSIGLYGMVGGAILGAVYWTIIGQINCGGGAPTRSETLEFAESV